MPKRLRDSAKREHLETGRDDGERSATAVLCCSARLCSPSSCSTPHHNITNTLTKRSGEWREGGRAEEEEEKGDVQGLEERKEVCGGVQVKPAFILSN